MFAIVIVISLLASTIGAMCGIGGGIIIKPVLDLSGIASVEAASFLSGCTVLAMTAFSVGRAFFEKNHALDLKRGTPLAIGASLGGISGQLIFSEISRAAPDAGVPGMAQSAVLFLITLGTLVYTLKEAQITTRNLENRGACGLVGLGLGLVSSFLGIGGGPVNLMVLHYFFSMERKKAALNSLYIILFSQFCSLIVTLLRGGPAESTLPYLPGMILAGILGGLLGSALHKRFSEKWISKMYLFVICLILGICVWNFIKFSGAFPIG